MKRALKIECKRVSDPYDQMVIDIQSLPEQQQQIMSLRFEYGLNLKMIAEIMALPYHNVENQYWHALDKMRPSLREACKPNA